MSARVGRFLVLLFGACLVAYGVFLLSILVISGPDQVVGSKPLDQVRSLRRGDAYVRLEMDPTLHRDNELAGIASSAAFGRGLETELTQYFGSRDSTDTDGRVGFLIRSAVREDDRTYLFGTIFMHGYQDDFGNGFCPVRLTLDQSAPRGKQLLAIEYDAAGEEGARDIQGPEYQVWMDEGGESLEIMYDRLAAK